MYKIGLEIPEREITLHGKDGKATQPSKKYPTRYVQLVPVLVKQGKDYSGFLTGIWAYGGGKYYCVQHHSGNGRVGCASMKTSRADCDRWYKQLCRSQEYDARKREIYIELDEQLKMLKAEFSDIA